MGADESCLQSSELKEYLLTAEEDGGPSFLQTAKCPPPEWIPLLVIGLLLWLATTLVIYLSVSRFDSYRFSRVFIYTMTRRVLFYYVIFSLINVLIILHVKGTYGFGFISDVIEALCFVNFYALIWSYSGGVESTIAKLIGVEINLGSPPLCCLKLAPNVKITERFMGVLEKCLLQLPVTQFIAGIIMITLVSSGISPQIGKHWATTLISIIITISFVMSMYAIGMLYSCWSQFVVGRRVGAKFAVFKITIVLSKVQGVILGFCVSAVEPYGYYSAENRVAMWSAFIVCVECFFLSLAASFLYKRDDYDAPHLGPAQVGVEVGNGLELELQEVDLGKPALVIQNPNV